MSAIQIEENLFMVNDDMFNHEEDLYVNAVNTVGVMGGGLARQFATRYGHKYLDDYIASCEDGELVPGVCTFWDNGNHYVCNFPTKQDWKFDSELTWVASGMISLVENLRLRTYIKTIAVPQLGCGLGRLDWNDVKHIIRMGAQLTPNVKWTIYYI